ncbi:DNA repair protein RecN [Acetobacter aceti NRIC 0242]|uniref:DNA repair protein RecN n=1 Tax=Acetobacter aceti NBRC 14818 TaxID=887700 RepID=A0AB33IF76_ACEAC|nr:DNA repair protein RecN [Acetobacter aceti]TCS34248.1 DNA repair protein RecN (Recombination protein N) [Acetobacter aceti NBRC 14818]BCK75466.1 DNA repair protein RecN [Acetobacter aceti NBRC 14818]GAN58719.1 DNA repair protein RecN [Acetobacter aceti NBRC 14818]GBO81332.1 DNA repair protein RecN [Acetobacter aceti NRIC 0242]
MLNFLSIRDVVLIEALDLSFHPGLTALTGETGAGKSILLDSLGLALGERANARLIRAGASEARVTASFEVPADHPVRNILSEQGVPAESDESLILRRILSADGRSRAWVNDQPIGIGLLRRVAGMLVEIQGQHEQMGLADPTTHRDLLDAFGVPAATRRKVAACHRTWREARETLEAAQREIETAAREEEWLRHTIDELSSLAPQPDEENELAAQRQALQRNERRSEAVAAALAELTPRDRRNSGPAAALRAASRALHRLLPAPGRETDEPDAEFEQQQAGAQEALKALDAAEVALSEAESMLTRLAADQDADPRLLEQVEERLFALRAAARKFETSVSDLPDLLKRLTERLNALETGTARLVELEAATAAAKTAFIAAAEDLSAQRVKAARKIEAAVMAELKPLKLERARFVVELTPLAEEQWGAHGLEQATFLLAANPGQPPGPLGKVASGGELSRLMLAIRLVLAGRSAIGTLVFDEIDSGVGGATAAAIGERLHRLARDMQILTVTHSPQVAAAADHHLRIGKLVRNGQTQTSAAPLPDVERREEIARMLAGDVITDAARAAAESLLEKR